MASQIAPLKAEEKDPGSAEAVTTESDVEHGHLEDLEVDIGKVLRERQEHNLEDDTSPYPEGTPILVFDESEE